MIKMPSIKRLTSTVIIAALCLSVLSVVSLGLSKANVRAAQKSDVKLKFNSDKKFKIIQFTDTQDTQNIDPRTVNLMKKVLEQENPDLVVFTGDMIRRCNTKNDVKQAIDNIAAPVEEKKIPWLITFGNHDDETNGVSKDEMLKIYMAYPHNINKPSPKNVQGVGNMNVLINSSEGNKPVFNIWALDSGKYAPQTIAGQGLGGYDWIKFSQIKWYYDTSVKLEEENKKKIPSLMFFHIPLIEFGQMWAAKDAHNVTGERNETECPGAINSGLFSAMLERGDVKGVFVGHDHVNDYVGNYYGITLGYSANTGFGTYGLGGDQNNRMRGARVFNLNENNPDNFETHMIFAKDLGIQ